jgi:hypothetical protein
MSNNIIKCIELRVLSLVLVSMFENKEICEIAWDLLKPYYTLRRPRMRIVSRMTFKRLKPTGYVVM